MKPIRIGMILLAAILWGGCVNAPSPYARQPTAAAKNYKAIGLGSTRAEVEARLGPPVRQEDDAVCWETRYDPLNFTALKVVFDGQGRARSIRRSGGRGVDLPGYKAHSTASFEIVD